MEHEYYSGISLAIMAIFAVKKLGPGIAAYCDKEIDVSRTIKFKIMNKKSLIGSFFL